MFKFYDLMALWLVFCIRPKDLLLGQNNDMDNLMKKYLLLAALVAAGGANAAIVPLNINITFGTGLSDSQKSVFTAAKSFWESKLIGYADSVAFTPGINISASGVVRDGVGGILGSAGPNSAYFYNGLYYTASGTMSFDSADLSWLESNNKLMDVIVHEMAHVIGFGTLWTYNGLYTNGTGRYTGQYGVAAYRQEFDPIATYIPVELDGGSGTANGHWDESWSGGSSDLMTGYLEASTSMSRTTLQSFRDLGYAVAETVTSAPVPVTTFAISALAMFGFSARRKVSEK